MRAPKVAEMASAPVNEPASVPGDGGFPASCAAAGVCLGAVSRPESAVTFLMRLRFHPIWPLPALAALLAISACLPTGAARAQPPELPRIMADPDWIGRPVEAAWWQLDGSRALYRTGRKGTERTDVVAIDLATGESRVLDVAAQSTIDGDAPVFDRARRRALFVRQGSLYLRDLDAGTLHQLTGPSPAVSAPRFATDPQVVMFQRDGRWWRFDLATRVTRPLADLKLEKAPFAVAEEGLEADQLRYFRELSDAVAEQREAHEEATAAAAVDPGRDVAPWYLDAEGQRIARTEPSADGRWMLVVLEPEKGNDGKRDRMPRFVTRSGYVEVEDVRRLVGRDSSPPHTLWLLDLVDRQQHEIDLSALSGITEDPLADLKTAQDIAPHDADDPRPVRIGEIAWHPARAIAAVRVHAIDNKDRWLATIEPPPADGELRFEERHRLTDGAWINWHFNEFGWLQGGDGLWLLSEQSGYSHLYRLALPSGEVAAVTAGEFEVFDVTTEPGGDTVLALSNRAHPTEYDLYRISLADGSLTRLTELLGVESYARHPGDEGDILVRHSAPYVPPQLSVLDAGTGLISQLTDTREPAYRGIQWQAPAWVGVPSRHGAGRPIWSKFYRAQKTTPAPAAGRPAVIFVHGAGYTQNTHHKFPYYFREQMFHNLLTARGYHVLDMDYRASRGYGRDWRTAIYRQMGTPELEDLVDGVAWLVDEHGVDPQRVGIYGGSYGGFMTLMAMFNAPDVFAAGAALRPVTDWAHYNQPYTSNILNTPQVDPQAYRRSSPIEFVENLRGHLLISHGMLDDNVFYKDSVRLAQRLIDLEKTDWEMASYPLEPHGYVHPQSWLDQYRRILKLFESSIGGSAR